MTKFEALIKCRNHWQWLAITEADNKEDYYQSEEWEHNCACCQYVYEEDDEYHYCGGYFYDCTLCPLTSYAWIISGLAGASSFCDHDEESSYLQWRDSYCRKDRRKYAQKMVDACNQAINDMIVNGEDLSYE